MTCNGTIILDRDGVLNEVRNGYVKNLEELIIIKSSIDAIKMLHKYNFQVVVASNQAGFAKRIVSEKTLSAIEDTFTGLCDKHISFFYCLHAKSDNCECRKPKPGMLLEIKSKYPPPYIFVGDNITDYQAAKLINMRFVLVCTGHGSKYENVLRSKCLIFENLLEFVTKLCNLDELAKYEEMHVLQTSLRKDKR